jgi:hypothetical protein
MSRRVTFTPASALTFPSHRAPALGAFHFKAGNSLLMRHLVAAGHTYAGAAETQAKTAAPAPAPAGTPSLTAASTTASASTSTTSAALTLTSRKTWHFATSYLRIASIQSCIGVKRFS